MKNIANKKLLLACSVLLLLVAGVAWYMSTNDRQSSVADVSNDSKTEDLNLEPPTEQEKSAGDQQKQQIIDRENQEASSASSQGKANVIITDAGQYGSIIEVRSFISNHYEDGTCIIEFTQDTKTFSRSTPAYRDASTTICTNPLIKRSEFSSAGNWQVKVSYKSKGASGTSETKTIRIR